MLGSGIQISIKNNRNLQHNVSMIKVLKERFNSGKGFRGKRFIIKNNVKDYAQREIRKVMMTKNNVAWAIVFIIFLTGVAAVTAWGFS